MHQNMPKLMKIFRDTKLNGKSIDWNTSSTNIIRQAFNENNYYKYNDKTNFCCYKTVYKDKPSILILFIMELPGPITGSSSASEYVIELISSLESQLSPISLNTYTKEIDTKKKIFGLLKIIKSIETYEICDFDGYLTYDFKKDIY